MPKRLIHKIAEDYDVDPLELRELVLNRLDEEMISGGRGLLWINEEGQAVLEETLPKMHLRRGVVKAECHNRQYVYVYDREHLEKVAVKIPSRLRHKLVGKLVHFVENKVNNESQYKYVKV